MNTLWPHLLRPAWLLLLPVGAWLLWQALRHQQHQRSWQDYLPPAFQPWLLSETPGKRHYLPWLLLGLAWCSAILILSGPSWQRIEYTRQGQPAPLVILLSLEQNMLADDVPPNRLDLAKRKILDLLEQRQDAATAIIVYAGSAHLLVPLSNDIETSRNLLEALKPSIMPSPGQRADLAIAKGLEILQQSARGEGHLLLVGAELDESQYHNSRKLLLEASTPLSILGAGTIEGAPIRLEQGKLYQDEQGRFLVSHLDQQRLRQLAMDSGGHYSPLRVDEQDLQALQLSDHSLQDTTPGQARTLERWQDHGHWLLLPLLLLAAFAGRRGWLLVLPLCLMLPLPSHAFELDDLWWRDDQQGIRLLQQRQPEAAAKRFKAPDWQGYAHYQAGQYAEAAAAFARALQYQADATTYYNLGNALARSGETEAALQAYTKALSLQPDLQVAQYNKALLESLLEHDQEQSPQTPAGNQPIQDQTMPSPSPPGQADTSSQPPAESRPSSGGATQDAGASASDVQDSAASGGHEKDTNAAPYTEQQQALEQWLRELPDDPAELLRRKFWYQQQSSGVSP